jgi:hypothetical protein
MAQITVGVLHPGEMGASIGAAACRGASSNASAQSPSARGASLVTLTAAPSVG